MAKIFMPSDDVIERLAELLHHDYLDHLSEQDPEIPTHRPWADLAEENRELNRSQARDNLVKLHAWGFAVAPAHELDGLDEIPPEALEEMAIEEHRSWVERRRSCGYRYGPVRCDEPPDLRHPDMVAWTDLDESVREKDRRPIRSIPVHLRKVGLALVPR